MPGTLIVGGGIGGLSLARELTLRGLPVTVLERAPKLEAVGAGIIVNPNAMAVLEANGVAAPVRAASAPYVARDTHDHRGRLLATRDYRPLYASGQLAAGALVHRSYLHDGLAASVPAAAVRLDVRIHTLDADATGVSVETETGERFTADVLVGADGIHSMVRARFFGANEPLYLGYRSHRFVVENRDGLTAFTEFLGRGQQIGLVPIGGGQLYVWTVFTSARGDRDWATESAAQFRARFAQFTDARVRHAFVQVTAMDAVICTELEEIHQSPWIAGRVALLGDAAHAMSPGMGQGAGMAMEDAAVLAEELSTKQPTLTDALARYERRRRERVETVSRLSRAVIDRGQLSGRLACWRRNRQVARDGRDVARTQASLAALLAWPRG
jgi:2-polyprenyl-6-methoxyphenol hydroxylase-like FAD-dependent oxidoreductase